MLDPTLNDAEPSLVTTCCWMGLVRVEATLPEGAQKSPRPGWPWQGLMRLVTPKEGGTGSEDPRGARGTSQLLLVHPS